ncbi:MAG TPA: NIL domain-containing protein [Candidatus Dormibacteraeota bacterium]
MTFGRQLITEPVIYELGKRFELVTNIRRADVKGDEGWVLLELTGEPDELERGVAYLDERGVRVDPAEGDLVE